MKEKNKLLVIVGPTASGKTSLSIKLAKKFNGEVISADSRQVYRGLDIGTGKVTREEMQGIPHHLLDVTEPTETYTVSNYVRDGRSAIEQIVSSNKLPIIVGGTFLYIDAVIGKVSVPQVLPNKNLRMELEALSEEDLFLMLKGKDPARALTIDRNNKRRLLRALEIIETLGSVPRTQTESLYDTLTLGITISKEALQKNIHARLFKRLDSGMIEEVQNLLSAGLPNDRMEDLGLEYKYIAQYLQGKISREEMASQIETKSWQYSKRQMTWLKRDEHITWVDPEDIDIIEKRVGEFLS